MKRSTSFVIILLLAQSIACLTQTPQDASALIEASISSADLNAKDAFYYTFTKMIPISFQIFLVLPQCPNCLVPNG
jgi:hypothetical protein